MLKYHKEAQEEFRKRFVESQVPGTETTHETHIEEDVANQLISNIMSALKDKPQAERQSDLEELNPFLKALSLQN